MTGLEIDEGPIVAEKEMVFETRSIGAPGKQWLADSQTCGAHSSGIVCLPRKSVWPMQN